jgi:dihydrolipoamide dehydrogenase
MLANRAISMGRVAGWNAVQSQDKMYKHKLAVEVVYTEPEVGQVGLSEKSAAEQDINYTTRVARYNQNLKANISSHREGFLKIILDEPTKNILGASAIGYHAGDILAPIAVAIQAGLSLDDLLCISPANPTLSELLVEIA